MRILRNGFITGLILQLAVGPVFFFIVGLTLKGNVLSGLVGVLAVTLVDFLYITLAILGIGTILDNKKSKKILGVVSSIVLVIFGLIIIKNSAISETASISSATVTLISSFVSVFLLTISSPLTIIFFTSLFTAKALEYNYRKKDLVIFGFGTGLATLLFMGITVIVLSLIKGIIPLLLIQILNIIVGCLIIGYGIIRLIEISRQ